MSKTYFRTPKHYDGTAVTTHRICDLLPLVLGEIGRIYEQNGEWILAKWPEIIGPYAEMTQAVSFSEGVLVVKVKNSTLYSLLSRNDKYSLVASLRKAFPRTEIKTIHFRMG